MIVTWWGMIMMTMVYIVGMTLPASTYPVDANGVADFTIPREPIRFRIDGDLFEAPSIISAIALKRIAARFEEFQKLPQDAYQTEDGVYKALSIVASLFRLLLPGESGQILANRLLADPDDDDVVPIDLERQALPAFFYLMERYGLRPTQQSLPSSAGQTTGDSMAGVQLADSTGEGSSLIA